MHATHVDAVSLSMSHVPAKHKAALVLQCMEQPDDLLGVPTVTGLCGAKAKLAT
jgi:hypothetical protein